MPLLNSNIRIATSECFSTRPVLFYGHSWRRHLAIVLLGALFTLMVACSAVGPESVSSVSTPGDNTAAPQENDQIGPSDVMLAWDPVSHPSLRGYRVYYSYESLKYLLALGTVVDVGNVTVHSIKGLAGGRRYYFAVTAYSAEGEESDFSNPVFKDIP